MAWLTDISLLVIGAIILVASTMMVRRVITYARRSLLTREEN